MLLSIAFYFTCFTATVLAINSIRLGQKVWNLEGVLGRRDLELQAARSDRDKYNDERHNFRKWFTEQGLNPDDIWEARKPKTIPTKKAPKEPTQMEEIWKRALETNPLEYDNQNSWWKSYCHKTEPTVPKSEKKPKAIPAPSKRPARTKRKPEVK